MSNNPKAIRTISKKKLRSCSMEFNKKTGQYEFQIKESGRIIHRENVDDMHNRSQQEIGDWKAESMRARAQESLARQSQDQESED
jgi:hypothetical protein